MYSQGQHHQRGLFGSSHQLRVRRGIYGRQQARGDVGWYRHFRHRAPAFRRCQKGARSGKSASHYEAHEQHTARDQQAQLSVFEFADPRGDVDEHEQRDQKVWKL